MKNKDTEIKDAEIKDAKMNDTQMEAALRLMEALGGVDEKLLERSEAETGKRKGMRIPFSRISRVCAAVVCLMVLGTAAFHLKNLGEKAASSTGAVEEIAAAQNTDGEAVTSAEAEAEDAGMDTRETAGVTAADTETTTGTADGTGADAVAPDSADTEAAKPADSMQTEAAKSGENWQQDNARQMLEEYLPTKIPEGYTKEAQNCGTGEGDTEMLLAEWSSDAGMLRFRIVRAADASDIEDIEGIPCFSTEEDWKARIPSPEADGYTRFGLSLGNDIFIFYEGVLSREEIYSALDSSIR